MRDYRLGSRHGIRLMPTWPHISLGMSAHIARKYGHLSIHLPIGVIVVGYIGEGDATDKVITDGTPRGVSMMTDGSGSGHIVRVADPDECQYCGGDITDHIDGVREGDYGEDVDVLYCLVNELDDVLFDLETADPPVLGSGQAAILRGVRNAYRARLGLDHD